MLPAPISAIRSGLLTMAFLVFVFPAYLEPSSVFFQVGIPLSFWASAVSSANTLCIT
jgi:hypothetical protein